MSTIEVEPGENLYAVAGRAAHAAAAGGQPVSFTFNELTITAQPGDTAQKLAIEHAVRHEARYRTTDAYRAELAREAAPELLAACKAAEEAAAEEFLYQTGQFSRRANPPSNYPRQGSVCAKLGDLMPILQAAIA